MAAGNTVVNTNIMALNTHRSLKNVGNTQAKASERLSSGLRINSAADDAAGLAISEKMRAQIRGLDMASKNSQDAISLIQTAEGGMQEIDNMLQRIRELVVQASNDTNEYTVSPTTADLGDRQKIQDEIDALIKEIDSMSERVEFNKKKLIDGTYNGTVTAGTLDTTDQAYVDALKAFNDAKAAYDPAALDVNNAEEQVTNAAAALAALGDAMGVTDANDALVAALTTLANMVNKVLEKVDEAANDSGVISATVDFTTVSQDFDILDIVGTWASGKDDYNDVMDPVNAAAPALVDRQAALGALKSAIEGAFSDMSDFGGLDLFDLDTTGALPAVEDVLGSVKAEFDAYFASDTWAKAFSNLSTALGVNKLPLEAALADAQEHLAGVTAAAAPLKSVYDTAEENLTKATAAATSADTVSGGLYFQVGANAHQGWVMTIGSVKSDILGIGDGNGESTISVLDPTGEGPMSGLLNTLDDALTYVTSERSKLGAAQNRLEYTIKSLDISSENLSSSESRIRDTDMAKEMMNFTKANVLQQAAISMLAQANQAPQNLLSLLR